MAINDFFEKEIILKYIGRHFQKLIKVSQSELAHKIGKTQSYVNGILNGKLAATKKQLEEFAFALGMTLFEWQTLVKEAKKLEYSLSTGEDLTVIDITRLETMDFDNVDLIRVVMKREIGRDPTENDVKTIMEVIKLRKDS